MQTPACEYFHAIDGRLRIKVPEVKRSPATASEVEVSLGSLEGVTQVVANPTTGNVLVLFDSSRLSQEQIIQALQSLGCFRRTAPGPITPTLSRGASPQLVEQVAFSAAGLLVELAVRAAVSKLV